VAVGDVDSDVAGEVRDGDVVVIVCTGVVDVDADVGVVLGGTRVESCSSSSSTRKRRGKVRRRSRMTRRRWMGRRK